MTINGTAVRAQREKRSWSQEHLASASGLSVRTVQRVEADGVGSAETRLALAAALDVPVSDLQLPILTTEAEPAAVVHAGTEPQPTRPMFDLVLNLALLVQVVGVVVVYRYGLHYGPFWAFRVLECLLGIMIVLAGGALYRYESKRRRRNAPHPASAA